MLIFVFVDFWCCFVLVVVGVFLCCYVVKLGKAKKNRNKKSTPKKVEVLPGIFYKTSYGCMCQSYCFFFGLFSCFFACCSKNTIKIGLFDDFEMLIFSFFGQKSRVNNLAMVGSITWPSFGPKFCPERWPSY